MNTNTDDIGTTSPEISLTYSDQRGELFGSLAKAQATITGAVKDSTNPFYKSKFANLASCLDAVREPLSANDLCVIQTTRRGKEGGVIIITTIGHSSGQWMCGEIEMIPEKPGPQAIGVCMSYARRYALSAITGLAQIDDDAEGASARTSKAVADPEYLIAHNKAWNEHEESIHSIKAHLRSGNVSAAWEEYCEIPDEAKTALRVAATRGGCFTVAEGKLLKEGKEKDFVSRPTEENPDAGYFKTAAKSKS